jgi:hypothetical protein
MRGRMLFALVWLIIVAGLVLPLYPPDVATPGPPAAAPALLIADTTTPGCENQLDGADCPSTCRCAPALATVTAAPEPCVSLTIYLVVRPLPPGPSFAPQPPPPKLPAI